jgi:hypothetical protein
MAEWQPIETAPKDGTPVDLWLVTKFSDHLKEPTRCRRITDAAWDDQWLWFNGIFTAHVEGVRDGDWKAVATHWMPLPSPPASAE